MVNLNNYVIEKLHISNKSKTKYDDASSHITDDPISFPDYNYIVNCNSWKKNRFAILLDCVKEFIPSLVDEDDIKFAKNWENECKLLYKNYAESPWGGMIHKDKYIKLVNGDIPNFGTAKFVYNMLNFYLKKKDISIPRKQKIEKILHDYFDIVEENKDKMNWY